MIVSAQKHKQVKTHSNRNRNKHLENNYKIKMSNINKFVLFKLKRKLVSSKIIKKNILKLIF